MLTRKFGAIVGKVATRNFCNALRPGSSAGDDMTKASTGRNCKLTKRLATRPPKLWPIKIKGKPC